MGTFELIVYVTYDRPRDVGSVREAPNSEAGRTASWRFLHGVSPAAPYDNGVRPDAIGGANVNGMEMPCAFCDNGHQTMEGYWHCAALHGTFRKNAPANVTFVEDGEPVSDEDAPTHRGVRMLPLLWGMPAPRAYDAQERGELIVANSCIVSPSNPQWACPVCGHREGESRQWMEMVGPGTERVPSPDPRWWSKVRRWIPKRVKSGI